MGRTDPPRLHDDERDDGAERDPDDATRLRLVVAPGPRTRVASVAIDFQEGMAEPDAQALRDSLRRAWPLGEGATFTQAQWAAGKNDLLLRARSGGYPLARWAETAARVDPDTQTAELRLVAVSYTHLTLPTKRRV